MDAGAELRVVLRNRLRSERSAFAAGPEFPVAAEALARHLRSALAELAPVRLGLYWPFGGEFNAAAAVAADPLLAKVPLALPYARRSPREMEFRAWDGAAPTLRDECGIGTAGGAPVLPDVVVVPCVGFTPAGHRLGHGGGYYDRWLALHPQVAAVGVAWSFAEVDLETFDARRHDIALAFVITEHGVV